MHPFILPLIFASALYASPNPNHLFARDLPPCTPCSNGNSGGYADAQAAVAAIPQNLRQDAANSFGQTFDASYYPQICGVAGVVCNTLGQQVTFVHGGLTDPLGHWVRSDGTQVWAWPRWQSTLLFTAPGGSVDTYPAHCTVYTCVKGSLYVKNYDDGQVIKGDGDHSNNSKQKCACSYAIDADQYIGLM